jgi:hypothetical protein
MADLQVAPPPQAPSTKDRKERGLSPHPKPSDYGDCSTWQWKNPRTNVPDGFDLKTERTIKVKPFPEAAQPHLEWYYDENGQEQRMYAYEVDEAGSYVLDQNGDRKVRRIQDGFDPTQRVATPVRFRWNEKFQVFDLKVPYDNDQIVALLQNPQNASLNQIRGKDVRNQTKTFYLSDDLENDRRVERIQEAKSRSFAHSEALNAKEREAVALVLNIPVAGKTEVELKIEVQQHAITNPLDYDSKVLRNGNLEFDMLFALARNLGFIVSRGGTYSYKPESGNEMVLGSSLHQVQNRIMEQPHIRDEIKRFVRFEQYEGLLDADAEESDAPVVEEDPDGLRTEVERLRKELEATKSVNEQPASQPQVYELEGKEYTWYTDASGELVIRDGNKKLAKNAKAYKAIKQELEQNNLK